MEMIRLESLPPLARELLNESLEWMAPYGSAELNLLRYPAAHGDYVQFDVAKTRLHLVRESAWWAAGLLTRDRGEDRAHAARVLEAVMGWQFNEPGMSYHGTYNRAAEEAPPSGAGAAMWKTYDPNWRQFIGTTFLVILEMLPDRISPALTQKLEASVRLAVEGEVPGRFDARYTNIAMMHAVLLVVAGARFSNEEWTRRGVNLARDVYELFSAHGAFEEYNSPTYYGTDLYALRLWRLISPRAELVEWATTMERELWRDIAAYYHPRLRNLCGPFDRSYGMDMTRYVAGLGMFLRLVLPKDEAPFPPTDRELEHAHDFTLAPLVALVGADIPPEAQAMLGEPVKERRVAHAINRERSATAFLSVERMWGAERGSKMCGSTQLHVATAHWLQPDGAIGWLRLLNGMPSNATADATGMRVQAKNGAAPQRLAWGFASAPQVSPETWTWPGMSVRVKGDRVDWKVEDGGLALATTMAPDSTLSLELEFVPNSR